MKVSEAMSTDVQICAPDHSLRDVAAVMARSDIGSLPVGENDRLVGMITDRDITVRAVAEGKGPDTPVRDVMSEGIAYCLEDDDLDEVSEKLGEHQLHRVPVLNADHRLVGILALADIARHANGGNAVNTAVSGISQPGSR